MEPSPVEFRPEQLLEHVTWLRRLAGTLVLDAARADDVTQATLLEALQRTPARVEHPRAWLATTARNLARSFGRSDARRGRIEHAAANPEAGPATDEVVERTARHHLVVGAVLALAEPYRTTVLLRFFENLKPGAIAKRTGAPVETVRTRLKRGLELLRAELVQRKGNWAAVVVGLIDPGVHAATSRFLLAKAGVAGGVVGGVAMGVKTKVAIGVAVVACAVVVIVESGGPSHDRSKDSNAETKSASSSSAESANAAPLSAARKTESDRAMKAREIIAHVADESGAPLAGVRVGVANPFEGGKGDRSTLPFHFIEGSVATTTAEGEATFAVDEAHAKRIVDVAALADGFVPGWWPNARAGDRITLTLNRTGALAGVVRDLSGAPIAGAVVRAVVQGPRQFEATTTSAPDGSYRLAGYLGPNVRFSPDQWAPSWMTVAADGFATAHFWSLENVREERDGSFRLDPFLGRGATIGGRVVDAVDGSGIADADVWIRLWDPRAGSIEFAARSAADGAFAIERVPAWGVQRVGMHSPNLNTRYLGELHATAPGRGCDARSIDVPEEGARVAFTLRLARVGSVRGRVVDEAGQPVAGAWVGAAGRAAIGLDWRGELSAKPFERTVTDTNGTYELRDLSLADGPGTRVPLSARFESEQFSSAEESQVVVALEAGRTIDAPDLVVKTIPGLLVHVVDDTGHDVERAIVDKWIRTGAALGHDEGAFNANTRENGRLFIPLPASTTSSPRRTFLTVRAVGFGAVNRELDSETGSISVALVPEHHLHGRIREIDGRAGGGTVYVFPALAAPQDLEASLRTDERWNEIGSLAITADVNIGAGRFLVRGLGPGPWHVTAMRRFEDGSRSVVVIPDVTDENAELDLVLPRSAEKNPTNDAGAGDGAHGVGQVEASLTFADSGKPVLRPGYLALRAGGQDRYAFPIAPGRYLFENIPAGSAELRIDVPGGARDVRSLVVDAGRTTSLAVTVSTGLVARGRFTLPQLDRFQSGAVRLASNDGGGWLNAPLSEDGAYEVFGLLRGKTYFLSLSVQKADGQWGSWISAGPRRTGEEWTTDGAPRLVAAGCFAVRSGEVGPDFPDGSVVRFLDAEGMVAYEIAFHGRSNNYSDVLAVGTYTARLQIPGATTQEQTVTINDSAVSYVDFIVR